jgi:ABC-type transport system involved in multi-copper enzyme maturation permease subunit
MIWVTWRQHRAQAFAMLAVFAFIAIYGVALGVWARSAFNADGLPACLARSGGADCGATITSFFSRFNRGATLPLTLLLFVIPGFLGAVVGGPLLGAELERGTWQLAWSQTVPRGRWLAAKLGLVSTALVVFGAAITAIMTWAWGPLDAVSIRLQPPPFNFEGISLTCALLCAFGLALLAGLLLRNTIGAMVAGYFAWEVPFIVGTLLTGPLQFMTTTVRIPCAGAACAAASTNSTPPVTGHLGDFVTSVVRSGNELIVSYVPADRFWPLQFLVGGMYLVIAVVAIGTAVWLLHRRTT